MAELVPWLVTTLLTANGLVVPLTAYSAPTPGAATPLRLANRPEATTCVPPLVATRASTSALPVVPAAAPATGAHGSRLPAGETAASDVRLVVPTAVMLPPMYTAVSVTA